MKSMEKLSSGMRINRAGDDAAGLSISEGMRAQIRGLIQADKNARDAHSMIATGEGALGGATDMLQRMRELAIQSLNDSNTVEDRLLMQAEFRQLQLGIEGTPGQAQWSGFQIIDEHADAFHEVSGNNLFWSDEVVKIVNGHNDDLTVRVEGIDYKIQIPEGNYQPVEVLIDTIDDLLNAVNPSLIVNLTEQRTVAIQSENNSNLESIKGGASFLFYDYHLGTPPGMIVGFTKYEGDDQVQVVAGKSDELSFFIGNNVEHKIKFPVGAYTRQEVVDLINQSLVEKGHKAEAVLHGDNRIAITSDDYLVTGIGGNMIEVDGITSVLYDNRKSGEVRKTTALFEGRKKLTDDIVFNDKNNILKITHEGKTYTVDFLSGQALQKKLTPSQIVEKIQSAVPNSRLEVGLKNGRITIEDTYYGKASNVAIHPKSSAFEDLFVSEIIYKGNVTHTNGAEIPARFEGFAGLKEPIMIGEANKSLSGEVNGVAFDFELIEGSYTFDELQTMLNDKGQAIGLEFTVVDDSNTGQLGLKKLSVSRPYQEEDTFKFNESSSAFHDLFDGYRLVKPSYSQYEALGKTTEKWPPEGQAGLPEYTYTPAYMTSACPIHYPVSIKPSENELTFTLQGKDGVALQKSVTIIPGTYTNAKQFIDAHEAAFALQGIDLKNENGHLKYETIEQGNGVRLSGFGGSAYPFVIGSLIEEVKSSEIANAGQSTSSIAGTGYLPYPYTFSEELSMTVNYDHQGKDVALELKLAAGDYKNITEIQDNLNAQLNAQLKAADIEDNTIAFSTSGNRFVLKGDNAGSAYKFSNPAGTLFEKLFKDQVIIDRPIATRNGTTIDPATYLSGRKSLVNEQITINPHINDVLTFDLFISGQATTLSVQLDPGAYSASSIAAHINEKLAVQLAANGLRPDLVKAKIGLPGGADDDSPSGPADGSILDQISKESLSFHIYHEEDGSKHSEKYIIDKMRGSASYSLFYDSVGEPAPSYVVGVADISQGVTIEGGKNDTLIFDVNDEVITLTLPAKEYTEQELIDALNAELLTAGGQVVASVYEGKLKFSADKMGQVTLDGMRGNAREHLVFTESQRAEDDVWHFQVGANTDQAIKFEKIRMSARMMRVNTVMIDDPKRTNKALNRIDEAIGYLSGERGRIGAMMNRLEHSMSLAQITSENLQQSESLIRDVDIAKEKMNEVRQQVLLETSRVALTHSFAQPEKILALLRG